MTSWIRVVNCANNIVIPPFAQWKRCPQYIVFDIVNRNHEKPCVTKRYETFFTLNDSCPYNFQSACLLQYLKRNSTFSRNYDPSKKGGSYHPYSPSQCIGRHCVSSNPGATPRPCSTKIDRISYPLRIWLTVGLKSFSPFNSHPYLIM